mgnify:CR=1 FL=1
MLFRSFLDKSLWNVNVKHVQLDEIWCFVRKKDKNLTVEERAADDSGSFYLFTALDNDSKLIVTHLVGKRTDESTRRFVSDLESRIAFAPADAGSNRPQISTDGCDVVFAIIGWRQITAKKPVSCSDHNREIGRASRRERV